MLARSPFSLAVLLWTPAVLTNVALAQMAVVLALLQVFLVPIVRLLPVITGSSKRLVYYVAAFYALDGLFWIFDLEAAGGRELTIALYRLHAGGARLAGTAAPGPERLGSVQAS